MRRELWLPIVLVAVAALAATATAVVRDQRRTTTLIAGGESYTFCWQPPARADWTTAARDGMAFGADYLELSPRTGRRDARQS